MGVVIHLDGGSGGATGSGFIGVFTNYTDLITQFPTAPILSLAYVQNSQGTPWLPAGLGGTFYSKGTYLFDGVNWVSSVDEISAELQDILNNMNTQGLPSVLGFDNTTLDGQTIEALNGIGVLDLRDGINDSVKLIGANAGILISGSLGVISFTNNADTLNDLTSSVTNSNFGSSLVLENKNVLINKTGLVGLVYNQDFSWNFDTDLPNFPSQLSTQKGNYIQGVINSVSLGGKYPILKTNETAYVSQIGFNKGEAFELILQNTIPTADRLQTFQDANGIIALVSDIPTPLIQKAGLELATTFSGNPKKTLPIVFATPFPNANYSITLSAHTQNNKTFSVDYESRTATGFVINTHTNNILDLIDVTWFASEIGEN